MLEAMEKYEDVCIYLYLISVPSIFLSQSFTIVVKIVMIVSGFGCI